MIKNRLFASTARIALCAAFNNSGSKWKLDADGKIEMKDGNPVWIDADGTEKTIGDSTLFNLSREARTHREAKEAAEAKLAAFKDIDPEAARNALELAGKIDAKTLIEAGKVDEVKAQITSQFTGQLAEKDKTLGELQSRIDGMMISGVFSNSEFVRDGIAIPHDMFEAYFRTNFKVENGTVAAYDKAGNRLMSKDKMGEFAGPDEALRMLVEAHPQKDVIMRANGGGGSGSNGGGGNRPQGRYMKRAEFDQLAPLDQAKVSGDLRAGTLQIVD